MLLHLQTKEVKHLIPFLFDYIQLPASASVQARANKYFKPKKLLISLEQAKTLARATTCNNKTYTLKTVLNKIHIFA
jgi:hypothetical protein